MPDYKRLVSYMYTYEEGKKRNNVGYVKVESRNGQCKFTIHATALSYGDKTITVYGFRRLHGSAEGIKLGSGTFRNGILDTRIVSDPEHLAGSDISINDIGGIVLYLNDVKYLATSWEEEAITYSQVISIVSKRSAHSKSVTSSKNTIEEKVETILPKVEMIAAASVTEDTNIASVNEVMKEVYPENIEETIENETIEEGMEESYPEHTVAVENEVIEEEMKESYSDNTIEEETTKGAMEESHTPNNVVSFDGSVPSTDHVVSSSDSLVEDISNNVVSESYAQLDTLDTQEALEQQSAYYNPYPSNQSFDTTVEVAQLFRRGNHNPNNNQNKTNSNNMMGSMNYSRYRNRTPQNQRQHQQNQQQNEQRQHQRNQQQNGQREYQQEHQQNRQRQYQQDQQQNQERQFQQYQQYQQQYYKQNHMPQKPNNCMEPTPVKPNIPLVTPQDEPYIASRLVKEFPRMHPFEDNEVVWSVKIEPKDLGILPVDVWPLANNSFLLHGFYAHKHLLFAKMNSSKGMIYILCVPGIYNDRERFLGKMFGFENFKCVKRGEAQDGESGYWYLPIRLA